MANLHARHGIRSAEYLHLISLDRAVKPLSEIITEKYSASNNFPSLNNIIRDANGGLLNRGLNNDYIQDIQNQVMVDYFLSTFNFLEKIESDRLVSLSLCYYCFYCFEIVSMERDSIVKHPTNFPFWEMLKFSRQRYRNANFIQKILIFERER